MINLGFVNIILQANQLKKAKKSKGCDSCGVLRSIVDHPGLIEQEQLMEVNIIKQVRCGQL